MNQELVDRSLAYVEALRSCPIKIGMEFDHETLVAISTGVPDNKYIRTLFPSGNGLPQDYPCEIQCDRCKSLKKTVLRKTQVVAYMECLRRINSGNHKINYQTVATCDDCKQAEVNEQKQKWINTEYQNAQKRAIELPKNTDFLIKNYLLVDGVPSNGSDWQSLAFQMRMLVAACENDRFAEAIIELEYGEFLRTPYRKIISYEVKKKNKFRCVMCDSSQLLHVHHKTYELHGYEHTYEGMRCLTCVCDECHAKHHGHYE